MADIKNATTPVTVYGGENPNESEAITYTTDGSKKRLDVNAKLEDSDLTFQLQAFNPVVTTSVANTALSTGSWTTILSVTDVGKLDFIAVAGSLSTYRVRLTVDSIQIFDLPMSDLSAIGLSNATNVPIWAETADKNFRYRPGEPVDFTASFLIEAKAISGSPTINWLINHRVVA